MIIKYPFAILSRYSSKRFIRTGFFRSDPEPSTSYPYFFRDPRQPLFARPEEIRFCQDGTLKAPVLQRSNVGMAVINVNRPTTSIDLINPLYRSLRNEEVNSTKKFMVLSGREPGWRLDSDDRDWLMLAEGLTAFSAAKETRTVLSQKLLNLADLSLLVADFRKPLVTLLSGSSSILGLSAYSGAGKSSFFRVSSHLPLHSGMSYLLATLPSHVGHYLALTGLELSGEDLIHSGISKHWLSWEGLEHMEYASEGILEVSERDGRLMLQEHFLDLPGETWKLGPFLKVISDCFSYRTMEAVIERLHEYSNGGELREAAFAKDTLSRLFARSPLILTVNHELVHAARDEMARSEAVAKADNPYLWGKIDPNGLWDLDRHDSYMEICGRKYLEISLRREIRVMVRVFEDAVGVREVSRGLVASLNQSENGNRGSSSPSLPTVERFREQLSAAGDATSSFFSPFPDPSDEYRYVPRSEVSLSSHPKLRKFHPDFDPRTGLDHDPRYMAQEVKRWADNYLEEERDKIHSALIGKPSRVKGDRWTEVVGGSI